MFEWIIVFCIAADLNGNPVNRCFGMESGVQFQTKVECRVAAQSRVDWVMKQLVMQNPNTSPVVTGVCGESKRGI
jgi:hypothetical protein